MNRISVFLILLAFCALAFAVDTEPYFPMGIGFLWEYQDSTVDGYDSSITTIVGTIEMDGYTTCLFVDEDSEGNLDTTYYQYRADGIYTYIQLEFEDVGVDLGKRAVKVLPAEVNVGNTWQALYVDTTVTMMGFTGTLQMDITGEFTGFEDVITPLGVFTECIRMEAVNEWKIEVAMLFADSGEDIQLVSCLAEDVGEVYGAETFIFAGLMGGDVTTESWSLIGYDFTGITSRAPEKPMTIKMNPYPNPFNSSCIIDAPGCRTIEICDLNGRNVATIDEKPFKWEPGDAIEGGIYLVRAITDGMTETTRIIYIK